MSRHVHFCQHRFTVSSALRDPSSRDSLRPSLNSCLSTEGQEIISPPGRTQEIRLPTVAAAESVPEIILSSVRAATDAKAMAMETTDAPMVAKDLQARGSAATIGRIRELEISSP